MSLNKIVFIDVEVDQSGKTLDIGACKGDGSEFHSVSALAFSDFLRGCKYICGHNILKHDLKYLSKETSDCGAEFFIDTLYFSPLLYPKQPYHRLVKDDKLSPDELNNPLNDAKKTRDLFYDEVTTFKELDGRLQQIYFGLLRGATEFKDFFKYIGYKNAVDNISAIVSEAFEGRICFNAPLDSMVKKYPTELAYALALISVIEHDSNAPPWVLKNYPRVENILHYLRSRNVPS